MMFYLFLSIPEFYETIQNYFVDIFNAFNATLFSYLVGRLENSLLLDYMKYMHSMCAFSIQHCNALVSFK